MKILHLITTLLATGAASNLFEVIKNYPSAETEHVIAYAVEKDVQDQNLFKKKLSECGVKNVLFRGGMVQKSFYSFDKIDYKAQELERLVKRFKPDVIHITDHNDFLTAFIVNAITGIPVVPVIHYLPTHIAGNEQFINPIYKKLYADGFDFYPHYAVSRYAADFVANEIGAPKKTQKVLVRALDLSKYSLDQNKRNDIRNRYGIPQNALVVGVFGHLGCGERMDWFIEGLQGFVGNPLYDIYLFIVIRNRVSLAEAQSEFTLEKIVPSKMASKIKIAVEPNEWATYFNVFDIFALSAEQKAFSLESVVALSMGVPVIICTPDGPIGGEDEGYGVVKNNVNGCVVQSDDKEGFFAAFKKLIEDEKLRKIYGSAGPLSVNKFDSRFVAESYWAVFQEAVKQKKMPYVLNIKSFLDLIENPKNADKEV